MGNIIKPGVYRIERIEDVKYFISMISLKCDVKFTESWFDTIKRAFDRGMCICIEVGENNRYVSWDYDEIWYKEHGYTIITYIRNQYIVELL